MPREALLGEGIDVTERYAWITMLGVVLPASQHDVEFADHFSDLPKTSAAVG
jgi:hypothetical protein